MHGRNSSAAHALEVQTQEAEKGHLPYAVKKVFSVLASWDLVSSTAGLLSVDQINQVTPCGSIKNIVNIGGSIETTAFEHIIILVKGGCWSAESDPRR